MSNNTEPGHPARELLAQFPQACRELYQQGIIGITTQGRLYLKISTDNALRIASDKTTAAIKVAVILWILETRSYA